MQAGEVVEVDFGTPIGSEAGFRPPAVMMTADAVLRAGPRVVQVVPITSYTTGELPAELPLEGLHPHRDSVAQAHLLTTISTERLTGNSLGTASASEMAQVRQLLADLLDIW